MSTDLNQRARLIELADILAVGKRPYPAPDWRSDEFRLLYASRPPEVLRALVASRLGAAEGHGEIITENEVDRVLWELIRRAAANYEVTTDDRTHRQLLAVFVLLGIPPREFFEALLGDDDGASWPPLNMPKHKIATIAYAKNSDRIKNFDPIKTTDRRVLAAVIDRAAPGDMALELRRYTSGESALRGLAGALLTQVEALVDDGVPTKLLQQLRDGDAPDRRNVVASPTTLAKPAIPTRNSRTKRLRMALGLTLIGALVSPVLILSQWRSDDGRAAAGPAAGESAVVKPAVGDSPSPGVVTVNDSPVAAKNLRVTTLPAKRAEKPTADEDASAHAVPGESLKVAFDLDISAGAFRPDEYLYLQISSLNGDPSDEPRWINFSFVKPDGTLIEIRDSSFAVWHDDDSCGNNGVELTTAKAVSKRPLSSEDIELGAFESSMESDLQLASHPPAAAVILGREVLTIREFGVIDESAPTQLEFTFDVLSEESGTMLDGGPVIRFNTGGASGDPDYESIGAANVGQTIRAVVSLHNSSCGTRPISPSIRLDLRNHKDAGYVDVTAYQEMDMLDKPHRLGSARLSLLGPRGAHLEQVPGTTKLWRGTCKRPKVMRTLPEGIMQGGVAAGDVPGYEPRAKCETHIRWITFDAKVVER